MASAGAASDGSALAAIETAARWWGAGLSSATVRPSSVALAAITPSLLDAVGRALCRSGESLHVIAVREGRVSLTPCGAWTVHGSADPATWRYTATLSGPDATQMVTLDAASVVHVRYAPHPSRPWAGRSPMQMAVDTARAAGLLETATAGELNFTQTQMLTPRRSAGDYGLTDALTPDTIQKIVVAFAEHVSTGAFVIPADVQAQRLGPEPPDSFPLLRDRLENSILSLHGLPPALVAARGTGTALRESFRQVLHSLLKPLGALVVEELRAKLDEDAELDFTALRAGDIAGTARAFGSLVTAASRHSPPRDRRPRWRRGFTVNLFVTEVVTPPVLLRSRSKKLSSAAPWSKRSNAPSCGVPSSGSQGGS